MTHSVRSTSIAIGLAVVLASGAAFAEEQPRLTALEMSEIDQALAYHKSVSSKVVDTAVENYPLEALKAGEVGRVVLSVDVAPDGKLADVKVLGGSDASQKLVDAGIEAAKAAAPFEPYDPSLTVMFQHIELQIDYAIKE